MSPRKTARTAKPTAPPGVPTPHPLGSGSKCNPPKPEQVLKAIDVLESTAQALRANGTVSAARFNRAMRTMNDASSWSFGDMSPLYWRSDFGGATGRTFQGKRDVYEALGYIRNPKYADYALEYRRGFGKRIVDAPVRECWRAMPKITEGQEKDTPFDIACAELIEKRQIFHYMSRADRLGKLGQYSVLLLGFDDGGNLQSPLPGFEGGVEPEAPISNGLDLTFVRAYSEGRATITQWEMDQNNPRYTLPTLYLIYTRSGPSEQGVPVHWSRIIHYAEDALEDEVYGQPGLEAVFNRLLNLEIVVGGGSEGYWRGAFTGHAFEMEPGATLEPDEKQKMIEEIDAYVHDWRRYMLLKGVAAKSLATQVADPSKHIDAIIALIAGITGIPKRRLMGSDIVLASDQETQNWLGDMEQRRLEQCEPKLMRPTINRLILTGTVPPPETGKYSVVWPPLRAKGDSDKADIAVKVAQALQYYCSALGGENVLPAEIFTALLPLDESALERVEQILNEQIERLNLERIQARSSRAPQEAVTA